MTTHIETGSVELWLKVMHNLIGKDERTLTCVDLCCNEMTATRRMHFKHMVGVDVADWPTRWDKCEFVKAGVLDFLEDCKDTFDVAICSDGIEHLSKRDGEKLLKGLDTICELGIIFTPLGPYMLNPEATDPDAHKSAWLPEELEATGWQTRVYLNWHPTLGIGAFFAWKGSACK